MRALPAARCSSRGKPCASIKLSLLGVVDLRALLKFVLTGLIVLGLVAGILISVKYWRLWQLEADGMAAWRPTSAHTETRYLDGIPLIPIAAQSETANLDRYLEFSAIEDAALAENEANDAALRAGWIASDRRGSYSREIGHGILAVLKIHRIDSRLSLSFVG